MVSDEAEIALRRRPTSGSDTKLRPAQIDALGDLARSVLRGSVLSTTVMPPRTDGDGMQVDVDYARGLCAFADEVALVRARGFAARYYGLDIPTTGAAAG